MSLEGITALVKALYGAQQLIKILKAESGGGAMFVADADGRVDLGSVRFLRRVRAVAA